MPKINSQMVFSMMVAAVALGGVWWAVGKLPSNSLTAPVKAVAAAVK